ncbi:putative LRR receptor-like serine/threonine-protein kinase [Hordeum vulgare]|nr:putative LRR receptor-like serine/threonine-protein kinase [Hordeum vulgare]
MPSFWLEETIQPLLDVVESVQGWMLRMESFKERAEAALGTLSLASPVMPNAHVLQPLVLPDDDFEIDRGAKLHGRFSPHARTNSPSSASQRLHNDVIVTLVLQIMPELRDLCEDPVLRLSVE